MDTFTARKAVNSPPGMLRTTALLALLCGLLCVVSCNRSKSKGEQLAALETAKQAGALSQEEYEAKKAAIEGTAAPAAVAPAPEQAAPTAAIPPQEHPVGAAAASATQPAPTQPAPSPSIAPQPTTPSPAPTRPAPSQSTPAPAKQPNQVVAKAATSEKAEPEPAPAATCDDPEYKSHKAGPEERFFPLPEARVKAALIASLKTLDFTIHKDDGDDIEASKNRHASVIIGAGGERETLHLEAATKDGKFCTRVSGDTKKRMPTQKPWTAAILAQTACNLK